MKRLHVILLLSAGFAAAGHPTPAFGDPPLIDAGHPAAPASVASSLVLAPDLLLQGGLGFRSLDLLLNRSAWSSLSLGDLALRSGSAVVDLADPLQAVVLFNAWHLPSAGDAGDIRLLDLRRHILRRAVTFTAQWPEYSLPGFIVLVQKRDLQWVLVARLSGHYLVEDRSGVGLCAVPSP